MQARIRPVPPYDFSLSATLFLNGDQQVRVFRDSTLFQPVCFENAGYLVIVQGKGSVRKPVLSLDIQPSDGGIIDPRGVDGIPKIIEHILNTNLDLTKFYRDIAADPIFSQIGNSLVGLKPPQTRTIFEALVESIIEQQISILVARKLVIQLVRTFGRQMSVHNQVYFLFPEPEILAKVTDEEFRSCGLSIRKGEYIREIAAQVTNGYLDLDRYHSISDPDQIINDLCELRGIGKWTAEFTVLRSLGWAGTFPADDLGIRRVIGKYYREGKIVDSREAREIAEAWGDWKGLAAFYLLTAEAQQISIE